MNKMEMKRLLYEYLKQKKYVISMKSACEEFLRETEENIEIFPPFLHILKIDVMHLFDISPNLGEFLIAEPIQWQCMCNEILFDCLQSKKNNSLVKLVSPAQVVVRLRISNLPQFLVPENRFNYNGLVSFQGLLQDISKPTPYLYHTVWCCPEECEGTEVILHGISKFAPNCHVCNSSLFEKCGFRKCGEQVTATFIIKKNECVLPQNFIIVDDLIPKLQHGGTYKLIAVLSKKSKSAVVSTDIWSVEEVYALPAPMSLKEPDGIGELLRTYDGMPWKVIYPLAARIGVNVCPANCFLNLKINLLLSLASIKANRLEGSSIIHVLVAGYDTGYVERLMKEAAMLAERHVFFGAPKTELSTALIASSGGVFALPIYVYNEKLLSSLFAAIENGKIPCDAGKVQLKSAVWIHGIDYKKTAQNKFSNVFPYVCHGDMGEHVDNIEIFLLFNREHLANVSKEEHQALRDLKIYLDLIAGMSVSLDEEAKMLLQDYFLTARKANPLIASGSMKALIDICLTSARLCRRNIADIHDAVFAIWLHACGTSEPRIAPEEHLQTTLHMQKLQNNMIQFKNWLFDFISVTNSL